jgi:hypothetical protein
VRRAAVLLLTALSTPALAGPGSPAAAPRPSTYAAATEALARSEERLLELLRVAREDPRVLRIQRYLALKTPDDFASTKRDRVADLAKWMADVEAPMAVREKARDALKSPNHRSIDPDLQVTDGRHSKRIAFCLRTLVPMLDDDAPSGDETTRAFAADVLQSYWHSNDPDVLRYNPRAGNEKSWASAIAAWKRYLAAR